MRAFREEDAAFFFGREVESRKLLELVLTRPLVALQGASGSGKSSIARAGLLPVLRSRHLAEVWEMAVMQPRFDPFAGLAEALIDHLQPTTSELDRFAERDRLRALLSRRPEALAEVIERLLQKLGYAERLLLFIDQWEELYTLVNEEALRAPFIKALLVALDRVPLTILLTVRADHADQALAHPELLRRAHHETMTVGRMEPADQMRTIVEPARLLDIGFEPHLPERILDDLGEEPGALPLLEHMLEGLWHNRSSDGRLMTYRAYDELGGVRGAIARQADRVFEKELTPEEQDAARDLLLSLVRPGEGQLDNRRPTALAGLSPLARAAADKLTARRLLVASESHIEVTHEALIRAWGRLRGWVQEHREFLLIRDRLEPEAGRWSEVVKAGDPGDDLLVQPGRRLTEAHDLVEKQPQLLAGDLLIRRYIAASLARAERLEQAAELARQREVRRTRLAASILAVLVILAAAAGGWAFLERGRALSAADRAVKAQKEITGTYKLAVSAGENFLLDSAARMRDVTGLPSSVIEGVLSQGESFFQTMASRVSSEVELGASLARLSLSLAEGSGRDSDSERQIMRAREARERLRVVDETQLDNASLALLAKTYEIESQALFERQQYDEASAAAEAARRLRRTAIERGDISAQSVLGLVDSLLAVARVNWKRLAQGQSEPDARACLAELDKHTELLQSAAFVATRKRAQCMQQLALAVEASGRPREAREINRQAFALTSTLLKERAHDRKLHFTHMALANNLGATYDRE